MSQSLALEEAFKRALEAIPARVLLGGVAVAYSGGLDSSVLLHLAANWARQRAIPIHALHVHHGLSPNADQWALHCQQECAAMALPCQILRVQVAADGDGLEQAARHARYEALLSACRRLGVSALLSAHHQDDQAETVLLNLLRGSGLAGLGGMHEQALRSADGEVHLLRPLLDQPRQALESWAQAQGLRWVEDESNQSLHLRRNLVRHVLLPAVQAQFPAAVSALARSATHLRSAQSLLAQLAAIDLALVGREEGRALDIERLSALPQERIDNLLRYWLRQQGLQAPSAARLEALRRQMLHAVQDRQPQWQFENLMLYRAGGAIRMHRALPAAPMQEVVLRWQGEARLAVPDWYGALLISPSETHGVPATLLHNLRVAVRSGGERLQIDSGRPSRSLKNLYQERAMPAWSRPFLPLVYGQGELVFAAGLGMDSRQVRTGPGYLLDWESELFN